MYRPIEAQLEQVVQRRLIQSQGRNDTALRESGLLGSDSMPRLVSDENSPDPQPIIK